MTPRKDNSANPLLAPYKKIRRTRTSPQKAPERGRKSRSRLSAAGTAASPVHARCKPPTPSPKRVPAPPRPRAGATAAHEDRAHATGPFAPIHRPCAPIARPASQPAPRQPSPGPGTTNCQGPTAATLCQVLSARSARAAAVASDAGRPVVRCESPREKTGREKGGVALITGQRNPAVFNRTAHP